MENILILILFILSIAIPAAVVIHIEYVKSAQYQLKKYNKLLESLVALDLAKYKMEKKNGRKLNKDETDVFLWLKKSIKNEMNKIEKSHMIN